MSDWENARKLLERFEREGHRMPKESELLVADILRACGHEVRDAGFVESDTGVDCFFDAVIEGKFNRIGVEVKAGIRAAGLDAVDQAFALKRSGHFDRSMVISRAGFTPAALFRADLLGAGEIDLWSPVDLRNWLFKHQPLRPTDTAAEGIIRAAMRELAKQVALDPAALATIEWRDLERILREVFEGMGYETRLTRPAKDGGFDLELKFSASGEPLTYLVEVKHWTDNKPSMSHLNKLIEVTASQKATGGVLLSTSGFTQRLYSGLAKIAAPVRVGEGAKIIALCKAWYRLQTGFWLEATDLHGALTDATTAAGPKPSTTSFQGELRR